MGILVGNWYKNFKFSQVNGEWWIQGGTAYYADGDVGDMNHEAYVIEQARSNLADDYDPEMYENGWDQWKFSQVAEIVNSKIEELQMQMDSTEDPNQHKALDRQMDEYRHMLQDPSYYADDLILAHSQELGIDPDEYMVANEQGDARLFGMKNYGWKRVEGHHVETWTLTRNDLESIANGLWDAYQEEAERQEFNIEVRTPSKFYYNVPYDVIADASPSSMREYDSQANISRNYRPRYASWYGNFKLAFPINEEYVGKGPQDYLTVGHGK